MNVDCLYPYRNRLHNFKTKIVMSNHRGLGEARNILVARKVATNDI